MPITICEDKSQKYSADYNARLSGKFSLLRTWKSKIFGLFAGKKKIK